MSPRVLLAVLAALLLGAGPAAAAAPSDLSTDPLDRATLLALPSVYRVDTTIRVDALRLAPSIWRSRRFVHGRARAARLLAAAYFPYQARDAS